MAEIRDVKDTLERIILRLQRLSTRYPPDEGTRILDAAGKLRDRLVELEKQAFAQRTQELEAVLEELNGVSSRVQNELEDLRDFADTLNRVAELISKVDTVLALA
ncbi:MAG: hypothetical protein IH849_03425 [Acidobacteria bacterium]|nr:hypothetical protein [Acidobacteriota bacterium]